MRWEKPDGRGSADYYCSRVHGRRYGNLGRKELKNKSANEKPPAGSDEPSAREIFDAKRQVAVDHLVENDRSEADFGAKKIEVPRETVEQKQGPEEGWQGLRREGQARRYADMGESL